MVQPGYLGIPFDLVRSLTETYRTNLPAGRNSDVVLGIHCHVARDREEAIENGALALSSQAEVFLRGRLSQPVQTEQIQTYATKSTSKQAFGKLCTSEKARQAVAKEGPNVMAVWGTPDDCIEKIKFYVDAIMRRRSDADPAANLKTARISHRRFVASIFFPTLSPRY